MHGRAPTTTIRKDSTNSITWTFSPKNNEELSFSLPSLCDAIEIAMVDWDSGKGDRLVDIC